MSTHSRKPMNESASVLPDAVAAALLTAIEPAPADPARIARARKELMRRIATESAQAATMTLRASDRAWERYLRGVDRLVLSSDGTHHTWLLRVAPGAGIPAHDHDHGDEESFILDGSCTLNGEHLAAGDYHLARQGSRHDRLESVEGCLFWLRLPASQASEMSAPRARI